MDRSDIAALLASGGVPAAWLDPAAADQASSAPASGTAAGDDAAAWGSGYNGMLNPPATETLGSAVARAVAQYRPTTVLVWENPPDLMLAHVVARELSAAVVRAFDVDGLIEFTGTFPDSARAVLLADAFRSQRVAEALAALVRQQRGTPVAVAQLFTVPGAAGVELAGVPGVVLARGGSPASSGTGGRTGAGRGAGA